MTYTTSTAPHAEHTLCAVADALPGPVVLTVHADLYLSRCMVPFGAEFDIAYNEFMQLRNAQYSELRKAHPDMPLRVMLRHHLTSWPRFIGETRESHV